MVVQIKDVEAEVRPPISPESQTRIDNLRDVDGPYPEEQGDLVPSGTVEGQVGEAQEGTA